MRLIWTVKVGGWRERIKKKDVSDHFQWGKKLPVVNEIKV